MEIIRENLQVRLIIVGYPEYAVANNRIYNLKTGNEIKRTMKKYTEGYWLNRKFVSAKKIKFERPEGFEMPF